MDAGELGGAPPLCATDGGRHRRASGTTPPTHSMEFLSKVREFFHDVLVEFRRVSWPTRREVTGSTTVVIVMVLILAVFLAVVDHTLTRLVRLILR